MRRELHERFKQVFANHAPVWMQPHPGVDITPDEELLSPDWASDARMWSRSFSNAQAEAKMSQVMERTRGYGCKPLTVKRALLAAEMNVELAIAWLGDHPTRLSLAIPM